MQKYYTLLIKAANRRKESGKISASKSKLTGKKSKADTMYLTRWERFYDFLKRVKSNFTPKAWIKGTLNFLYAKTIRSRVRRRRHQKRIEKLPPAE